MNGTSANGPNKEVNEKELNVNVEKKLDDLKVNDELGVKKDENMNSTDVIKIESEKAATTVQDSNKSGQVELRENNRNEGEVVNTVNRESRASIEDEKTEF